MNDPRQILAVEIALAPDRARAGAKRLDELLPNWRGSVKAKRIDTGDESCCPIGQATGNGYMEFVHDKIPSHADRVRLGLIAPPSLVIGQCWPYYAALSDAWRNELKTGKP
jgi:hypothetical protein